MNQLDIRSRVSSIIQETESRLRQIVSEAAKAIAKETNASEVQVVLEDGAKAIVSMAGGLTVGGVKPGLAQILQVLEKLCSEVGINGAAAIAEPTILAEIDHAAQAVEAEVAHLAVEAEAEVKHLFGQ